jgi:adenosine/AMP kinase
MIESKVSQAIYTLDAIAACKMTSYPDVDFDINACELAAEITGYNPTDAKMLNKAFRENAAKAAFEMARKMVGSVL